jgi:hypothetical protein
MEQKQLSDTATDDRKHIYDVFVECTGTNVNEPGIGNTENKQVRWNSVGYKLDTS